MAILQNKVQSSDQCNFSLIKNLDPVTNGSTGLMRVTIPLASTHIVV